MGIMGIIAQVSDTLTGSAHTTNTVVAGGQVLNNVSPADYQAYMHCVAQQAAESCIVGSWRPVQYLSDMFLNGTAPSIVRALTDWVEHGAQAALVCAPSVEYSASCVEAIRWAYELGYALHLLSW